jgi:hypothetical protein
VRRRGRVELHNRQPVHVGAQHNRLAGPSAFDDAEHAGLSDALVDFDTELTQSRCDHSAGSDFLKTKLGMCVQIAPCGDDEVEQSARKIDYAHDD